MVDSYRKDIDSPPTTYMEWLEVLNLMTTGYRDAFRYGALLRAGSFTGSSIVLASLEQQIMNTINTLLTMTVARLNSAVNIAFEDNSYQGMVQAYKEYKMGVLATLFFEDLAFLPEEFRTDLKASITAQMLKFDRSFRKDIENAAIENNNSELESAVVLINYIPLFE